LIVARGLNATVSFPHIRLHAGGYGSDAASRGVIFFLVQDLTTDVAEQQALELAAREQERAQDVAKSVMV